MMLPPPYGMVGLVLLTLLLAVVVAKWLLGTRRPHRETVLLIGLPGSGKTLLFAQLTSAGPPSTTPTCTSMTVNRALVHGSGDNGASFLELVDHPGHRRLYPSLDLEMQRARKVVLVVDAVTIHDDRVDGAGAVVELLYRVIKSSHFYGVSELLIACTKRDEITSYSAKAVKRLLEAAMTTCIRSHRSDLNQVDRVVDAKGVVVGEANRRAEDDWGRRHELELPDRRSFSFDTDMPISFQFADVSSLPSSDYTVKPVAEFMWATAK